MPKISVISIAKKEEDLENLRKLLTDQTFQDFELVTSIKGTIPETWNDAVASAGAEFFIFVFPGNEKFDCLKYLKVKRIYGDQVQAITTGAPSV